MGGYDNGNDDNNNSDVIDDDDGDDDDDVIDDDDADYNYDYNSKVISAWPLLWSYFNKNKITLLKGATTTLEKNPFNKI